LIVNRILSSHSDVRAPIISGIVKIRTLSESFFKSLHDQFASPEMQERYLLLFLLSVTYPLHGLMIGRVALVNANKPDKVGSSFLVSLPKWANFLFCAPHRLVPAHH